MLNRPDLKVNKFLSLLMISVLCFSIFHCSPPSREGIQPKDLIPATSQIAMILDYGEIQNNFFLSQIVKTQEIYNLWREAGLKPSEVHQVSFFGDSWKQVNSNPALIIKTTANKSLILTRLLGEGWSENNQLRQTCFEHPNFDFVISFYREDIVIVGPVESVNAVIDAAQNPRNRFINKPILRKLNQLHGRNIYAIRLFILFSQEQQDKISLSLQISSRLLDLGGLGALNKILEVFSKATALGVSLSSNGNFIATEIVGMMKDEKASSLISGSIGLLQTAFKLIPKRGLNSKELQNIRAIEEMIIKRRGPIIFVTINTPIDDFLTQ